MAEAFIMHHIHTGGGGGGTDLVTWQNGSDDQIAAMVTADRAGSIDLRDYWSVGDERTVVLSAITPTTQYITESQPIQPITFVLLHKGGDNDDYRFIVGTKECLSEPGTIWGLSNAHAGTTWSFQARAEWCNIEFYNSIPASLQSIFKQWTCKSGFFNTVGVHEDSVYFALAAEKEVFGTSSSKSSYSERDALFQFDYYKTTANRIKKQGVNGSNCVWFLRSRPYTTGSSNVECSVDATGAYGGIKYGNAANGIAPIGRI